ncbi:MAG TPA: response regulator, partial [Chloroflexota bacterium]|nr:response regulator [Chloroflexota bacterium]
MATILIADDAAFMRMRCGRMLADHGYTVVEAENGRDAVAKYQAHRPD